MNPIDEIVAAKIPLEVKPDPMTMHAMFPTPVAFFKLPRALTDNELDFLMSQKTRPNLGNTTSIDSYVLRNRKLAGLRQFIEDAMDQYFTATHNPNGNVRLKITQSWVNFTEPGQFHHKHNHPNSMISGVFYVNADISKDKIHFFRDGYLQFKVEPKEYNIFNSESWWMPVGTCDLVLFPSSLMHMVETVQTEDRRISLAFNTFPTGILGSANDLTELNLERQ